MDKYERTHIPKYSDKEFAKIVADNMISIMKNKGYTQRYVAQEMGIVPSALNRYLKENRSPSIYLCHQFCKVCGTKLDALTKGCPTPKKGREKKVALLG